MGYVFPLVPHTVLTVTMKDRTQERSFQVPSSSHFPSSVPEMCGILVAGPFARQPKASAAAYIVLGICWTTLTNDLEEIFFCLFYVR